MKYLVLLAVVAIVYALWRGKRKAAAPAPPAPPRIAPPEDMVACAHCGVHLPRSDAVRDGERDYCCQAHRRGA